ncbi:hypothetical protein C8J56DRAFT_888353 [Mycena floridula]|nr:hypothetical protein C8J56DRAFT_888353 [Mycena floridula]
MSLSEGIWKVETSMSLRCGFSILFIVSTLLGSAQCLDLLNHRWSGIIKRRIDKIRGSNALWHQDGNEKLRPWGFWVHGCVNGDYGKENNGIEVIMIDHWGEARRAYIRGRSTNNVRIEHLWPDVRKDTLENFCQIFKYLEDNDLLDMEDTIHCLCLDLVFQPCIQASLDRTRDAWNHHRIRTAGNQTPLAMYELSRETAIHRGYWTGDPGDDVDIVHDDPHYRLEGDLDADGVPVPPEMEDDGGIYLNDDDDIASAQAAMEDFDFEEDDQNWGIDVFCRAVLKLGSLAADSQARN